ncbi:MAG TPA: hypothetical protein VD866_12775 [Urbifossiella sp.]|nr:hypothetical protein [Urbifossiella sp.]
MTTTTARPRAATALAAVCPHCGGRPRRTSRPSRARQGCRRAVLIVVREAGEVTAKKVQAILRKAHGPGTVEKALADLTAAGRLVNLRDKRGYRLAD